MKFEQSTPVNISRGALFFWSLVLFCAQVGKQEGLAMKEKHTAWVRSRTGVLKLLTVYVLIVPLCVMVLFYALPNNHIAYAEAIGISNAIN